MSGNGLKQPASSSRRHNSVAHRLGIEILRGEMKSDDALPTQEDAKSAGSSPGSPDCFKAEVEFHHRVLLASKNEALAGL
jgi:DNA-binding FadR family transcriptional regulator